MIIWKDLEERIDSDKKDQSNLYLRNLNYFLKVRSHLGSSKKAEKLKTGGGRDDEDTDIDGLIT